MRSKIAIVLGIVGLVILGLGIGQRTLWLPPATITAAVSGSVTPAPLTVIGPEVLKAKDGHFTLNIKANGPIQLAVGSVRDVQGWVADAAHTSVTGANADFTTLETESKSGVEKVPNPSGSDMWVSEEKADTSLSYTWQAPGHGDWALLLSSDGTAPAPTDISLTTANDAQTPWAIPLMVFGAALLALAALLLWMTPRKPKGTQPQVAGRRAAGRVASDPATGAMEVAKIVAAREVANTAAQPKPATIADARRAGRGVQPSDGIAEGKDAADHPGAQARPDHTSAFPASVTESPETKTAAITLDGTEWKKDGSAQLKDADADDHGTFETNAGSRTEGSNADSHDAGSHDAGSHDAGSGNGNDRGDDDGSGNGNDRGDNDGHNGPGGVASGPADGSAGKAVEQSSAESPVIGKGPGAKPRKSRWKKGGKSEFSSLRWGAGVAVVLFAGSLGPAVAADSSTAPPTPVVATPTGTTTEPTTEPTAAGIPALLDSQVQRIVSDVATVVASGDNAKDAAKLDPRVAGNALVVRTANYKIRSQLPEQAAPEPVNATKLLAGVVTTSSTWPRSAMFVTQGENNALPQLLTLVQSSAREPYKLVQATPLLPGLTFPAVDKEGTPAVALDASGLLMSPTEAVAAFSDRLTNADSKWKDTFKDSVYTTSVLEAQAKVLADAKDASYVFTHTADKAATLAMHTSDGGAMVVVGYTFGTDATSKENATLTISPDAAVFAGGAETTKGFTINYAEPVVMYIPPAGAAKQITIISATSALIGASLK
ncbi:hypothetical protein [Arthrobacter cryoconiti]|uniref:Glycosyl transferase n=1 Tax=Arthrobacter cryoconiti TaxID=748907 RepID=A0ABV8QYG1_9MICC|nr:hypothetical protein [Arthrobacter cryoconiti]MCC9068915.1 hypothetical protein [Arthrobacter cryoconiti]